MKAVVAAFNQEKALVGAFSVIVQPFVEPMDRFTALIKAYIASNLPPPPTPPEEVERRRQMAEELERLQKAEEERERLAKLKETDPEAYEREVNPKAGLYY